MNFGHLNWAEPVEFMAHCSMKWAVFLLSLRELVETGRGRPSPEDVKIDNWNRTLEPILSPTSGCRT